MDGALDKVKVVSFDLFDTLVLRPFMRPTDLFKLMGQFYSRDDFFECRRKAESEARTTLGTWVNLDEIYSFMPDDLKQFKELECQFEIDLCFRNPRISEYYDALSEGRMVIVTTDMYLPRDVIERILQKIAIRYDRLYISSENHMSKNSGTLFTHILEELGISPEQMFHIGDNRYADYRVPRKMGIQAIHIPSPSSEYLNEHFDERRFYKRNRSLTSSVILFMDMVREQREDVWEDTGDRYGGPLAYSFTKHICDNHKKGNTVLFTARDGYTLMRTVGLMDPSIESHYVYAQRILMEMIGSDISDIHIPSRLSDSVGHKRAIYTIAKILKFYSIDPEPSSKEEKEVIREYRDNIATILESQKKMYQSYRNQLYDKCSDSDVEIVDCTTMKMTSQRFIQKVIGKSVHGHYLVTLGNNGDGLEYDTLLEWPYNVMGWERIDIPEFLLCSPEMPIIGWDDGPVFDTGPECEKERAENYQKMSDAELGYVRRIREYYGETMPYLDYMTVSKWVLLITAKGTRYRDLLSNIKWASSADHSDWAPIVPWDDIGKSALRLISKVVGRINHK